jgi:GR25 family glycosyltransferase involved in LPS biosynthesis
MQDKCLWNYGQSDASKVVELFWINMDKSVNRKISMEKHLSDLGIFNRRIPGLSIDNIYFPGDILANWNQYEAKIESTEAIPRFYMNKEGVVANFTHVMSGLVGRTKGNRLKEVGCTSSHLEAMRQAIFENRTSSPYAIITEDDIYIPFNIDFDALARSAPADFGILQLFNSNEDSMASSWKTYLNKKETGLWIENRRKQAVAFWSTCAYLINRDVMRPVIEKVIYSKANKVHLKIIAGIEKPCRPKFTSCCKHIPGTQSFAFQHESPCFWAPKGFQADSFLYAMNKTYVLTIPLITNGQGGNESTFHQDHVESIHHSAFQRQRKYINSLIRGQFPLPSFVTLACRNQLILSMELRYRPACVMNSYLSLSDHVNVNIPFHIIQTMWRGRLIPIKNITYSNLNLHVHHWLHRETVYIPSDILSTWEGKQCMLHSKELLSLQAHQSSQLYTEGIRYTISGLCGRRRKNSLEDLTRTISHLLTLYQAALQSNQSRYVMIVEGDGLITPFDINYDILIHTAPKDFTILKLMITETKTLDKYWNAYVWNTSTFWLPWQDRIYDELGPKVYLVDLHKLQQRLHGVVHAYQLNQSSILYDFKIIGGLNQPCLPLACCLSSNKSHDVASTIFASTQHPACLFGIHGIQAERYLWRLGSTYVSKVPIFTVQMSEQQLSQPALVQVFGRHRAYMNELIKGGAALPPFLKVRCQYPVADIA